MNPVRIKALVENIESFGNGVFRVRFEVPKKYCRFKPGQFLHLTLDEYDPSSGYWPESRVFSIASPPKIDNLEIIYSVKGVYTKRMSKELAVGRELWLKFPYGDFIIDSILEQKTGFYPVLIAGGTGIAPFIPYLHQFQEQSDSRKIALFYAVRDYSFLMYEKLLSDLQDKVDISVFVEKNCPECYNSGLLDISKISALAESDKNCLFFLSGPPAMISAVKLQLSAKNVPAERIITDDWE